MENATKAMIIMANLMLAVMALSLIVYFYNQMKVLPQEQELAKMVEETRKFNQEYEVFDKKLMYGVDVISAINKADSNNEKYIMGNFLSGGRKGIEYIIDVEVMLTSSKPLSDTVEVFYLENSRLDEDGNVIDLNSVTERRYAEEEGPGGITFGDIISRSENGYAKNLRLPDNDYARELYDGGLSDMESINLITQEISTIMGPGIYNLLDTSKFKNGTQYTRESIESETPLKYIIKMTDAMSQTIRNTTDEDKRKTDDKNASGGYWSSFTWETALYDLKTRKFKCAEIDSSGNETGNPGIHYNEDTGAIDKLTFVEI